MTRTVPPLLRRLLPVLMAAWAVPCALPGADAEGGGGTGTSFTSKAGDFSVRYPAGWDVIDGPNDTILLLLMQQPKAGGVPTRSMAVVIHPAEAGTAPAAGAAGVRGPPSQPGRGRQGARGPRRGAGAARVFQSHRPRRHRVRPTACKTGGGARRANHLPGP